MSSPQEAGRQPQRFTLAKVQDVKAEDPRSVKAAFAAIQTAVEKALQSIFTGTAILNGRLVSYLNGSDDGDTGAKVESNRRGGTIDLEEDKNVAIPHGLGRAYRGFLVVKTNGPGHVWEPYGPTDPNLRREQYNPAKVVVLTADATVTVSLWVF